jgi:hypothetical protein
VLFDLQTVFDQTTEIHYGEYRVYRVALYGKDGLLIADLRVTTKKPDVKDWHDTECGRAVLEALRGGPLTGKQLIERSGYRGGWFRMVLTGLRLSGRVTKFGPEYRLAE